VLSWLSGLFRNRTAVQAGRENPILGRTVDKSALVYKHIPLRNFIDKSSQDALSRQLFLKINDICNAYDPVAACREQLAASMMKFAAYQVLIIPAAPEEDPSGLRGQPGITGQLGEHLVRIVEANHELRSDLSGPTSSMTKDIVLSHVQRSYWQWYWSLETINAARIELGDFPEQGDWFLPFKHAACVSYEATYRREIELPPAFDEEIAREAIMAYPIFTDIVLAGDKHPDKEWRDYHQDSNVPFPSFANEET
jgi:hypothetical protein